MARRKQQDQTPAGDQFERKRSYSLADALSSTQQHTVPVLPAEESLAARKPAERGSAETTESSVRRATLASRVTADHPTLADTAASTARRKAPPRSAEQPEYEAPIRANRYTASSTVPETLAELAHPTELHTGDIADEVLEDESGNGRALVPGHPTIALPTLTDAQLPALRAESASRDLAEYRAPGAPTVFIRGARKAPRPYVHVVPRRLGKRPFLVQFIVAMVTVMALFAVVTLATPLGQSAAFANSFQSYANAAPWVPTPTPTPRPTATPVPYSPPQGANPGQQAVINEIVAVFGSAAPGALAVSKCESGYDPNAWNSYPIGNSHAEGVFQILYPSTWDTTSYAGDSPYNYVDNIHAAYQIFARDGYSWREWECQP